MNAHKPQSKNLDSLRRTPRHPVEAGSARTLPPPRNFFRKLIKVLVLSIASLGLALGLYMLFLIWWPKVHKTPAQEIYQQAAAPQSPAESTQNTIYIPTAGIQAAILEGGADQLDKGGAWHRLPDRGNPIQGGNFIVTGHSFIWGYTPRQVKENSVFYNLGEVKVGDEILVRWDKQLYHYIVSAVKTVKPNATEIEGKTTQPTLTVYTCTPGGSADGRVVIVATPKT